MTVRSERDGPVTVVTIDRPGKRNAVDRRTAHDLADAFEAFDEDDGQLVGNVKSRQLPPGRGTLVSRSLKGGPQLIQTAYLPGE